MEEKELKTSTGQRIVIAVIAIIMIVSIIASYAAIVVSGSKKSSDDDSSDTSITAEKKEEYAKAYEEVSEKFKEATKDDYEKFIAYKSEVKAFNEESANESGVQKKELVEGTGEEVKSDGSNYMAYYIGYCADESIFDSSLNDKDEPTGFLKALDPSLGMIEGWTQGVAGMKIGGIRRITVPGELAYGDTMEICGGKNKPLRFIVMAVKKDSAIEALSAEVDAAYMRDQYAQMGMDYDKLLTQSAASGGGDATEDVVEVTE